MSDFTGARGSNTGDDFHELWAARHAIRLLNDRDPLQAMTVEGIVPSDATGVADSTWEGVDCALYEGGRSAPDADRVVLEQLKYSAANPTASWTVARLWQGEKRDDSVLHRLAKAWSGIRKLNPKGPIEVSLVTNQPIAKALTAATLKIAAGGVAVPRDRPKAEAADETKLAYASGLAKKDLPLFAGALRFAGSTGSRFAIEGKLLGDMAGWTDLEMQTAVAKLRQFIRHRMRPEFAGEVITKEKILIGLGVADMGALFPCPAELKPVANRVPRASVADAASKLLAGEQRICLHGVGGIGKTTALQQIETALPDHSVMVTFDCYGGGTYLDAAALRHRPIDAFLQLSNELATRLRLPILLGRHQFSDPARLFWNRLCHAARAHAAEYPDSLIVIGVDAADNSVTAAAARKPAEQSFIRDFLELGELPANVRFVVTARTGRLPEIALPGNYVPIELRPFSRAETESHVQSVWNAPAEWLDLFHELTHGVPRVQAYALDLGGAAPEYAIDRLLPGGRSLDQVFREQFRLALGKSGNPADVAKYCAGLIALARPVPLTDLSGVLDIPVPALIDICTDMAPAIRLRADQVGFADEDFEDFVRKEGASALNEITRRTAEWLFARCKSDAYAAQHVAGALLSADRGADLLNLVEEEPSPPVILDPVERREAELTRLRLAILACRQAGDAARAMRFVLIGGEGLKTERALRALLANNPDLAVRFAPETAGRLILTDAEQIAYHGAFLIQKQVVDAIAGDHVSLREGRRLIRAWMAERQDSTAERDRRDWRVDVSDVTANIETVLRVKGPAEALEALGTWRPRRLRLKVARQLVPRLLAQGEGDLLHRTLATGVLKPWEEPFLLVPMTIAGETVDSSRLAAAIAALLRRRLYIGRFLSGQTSTTDLRGWIIDIIMSGCELLATEAVAKTMVDDFLDAILQPANRRIENQFISATASLDLLFRAHALRAARAKATPVSSDLYVLRLEPETKEERERRAWREDDADRKLNELTNAIFPIYAATATALVVASDPAALAEMLEAAAKKREDNSWRLARDLSGSALAQAAARTMMLLAARGADSNLLLSTARRVHGRWGTGDLAPDLAFGERIALRSELHADMLADITKSVVAIRGRRIGADEKSKALLAYARLLVPISPDDASAIFQSAVEAASQLDREIIGQLKLLAVLFKQGRADVADRRTAARDLSEVLADAAIRLDGEGELPWDSVMDALAQLDLPLALANTAKWEDANLASFRETLEPVLKSGLATGLVSPSVAMALALMMQGDHGVVEAALQHLASDAPLASFLEEAAWDALIRHDHRDNEKLIARVEKVQSPGFMGNALLQRGAFLAKLPEVERGRASGGLGGIDRTSKTTTPRPGWARDVLLNTEKLEQEIKAALNVARASKNYISASEVVGWAAGNVGLRDRTAFLDALSGVKIGVGGEVVERLLTLLPQWDSPAVRHWASSKLPGVITRRLPDFIRHIAHGETSLPKAIEWTGMASASVVDLLLRGVELHGQAFSGDQVFALAVLIAGHLGSQSAAGTATWYARRLADRIDLEDRDQIWASEDVPAGIPEAVARFLYACMGDYDVRVRWRAAHAMRRLARLGATAELQALTREHGRKTETVFRSPALDFYWIAARMWFVIAFDRIAGEVPQVATLAGTELLSTALDQDFPHILLTSFARDACLKLAAASVLPLDKDTRHALECVGKSTLEPLERPDWSARGTRKPLSIDKERRFDFDPIDTIPYWYDRVLGAFADVSQAQLLAEAENWIIDRWGYDGKIRSYEAERRGHRFSEREWSLASNGHGANPTLERLNTHLEWHALWCAVGQLMKTEPLAAIPDSDWDAMARTVSGEMLTQPPHWSTDIRQPVPLREDFWRQPSEPLGTWVDQVTEAEMRSELIPADRPEYLLVAGGWRIATYERSETVAFLSALVDPELAPSLLRTLQTMESAWDYGLPLDGDESDHDEAEHGPYQMIPWLRTISAVGDIDELDPLRGNARLIEWMLGHRVSGARGLARNHEGRISWSAPGKPPMFLYEVWGENERDEERYQAQQFVAGRRLLVEREQLKEFLAAEGLELVIEVEIRREGRNSRRSYDAEDQTPEAAYDRVYRFDGDGGFHVAEGYIGRWAGDRSAA